MLLVDDDLPDNVQRKGRRHKRKREREEPLLGVEWSDYFEERRQQQINDIS